MRTQKLPVQSRVPALHIKKILVPSDFSASSQQALRYTLALARQCGAELVLMHILEPAPTRLNGVGTPTRHNGAGNSVSEPEELSRAIKSLRACAALAKREGVAAKSIVRNGLATHEIVEAAKELDVDLVVIGTHGHTGWKHFCIGSTAERVVRAAPCAVLVVREKEHEFV